MILKIYDFLKLFYILGLLCDLLWSDPDKDVTGWGENDRGVSFTFGTDVVAKFLNRHDLDLICRAHQVNKIILFYYFSYFLYLHLMFHMYRLLKMVMNFLLRGNWSHYFLRQTIVENLIMLVE